MIVLIDIGDTTCGIKVSYGTMYPYFTVLSHGKGDRREVQLEDPMDAAAEVITQARTLRLAGKLNAAYNGPSLAYWMVEKIRKAERDAR